MSESKRPQLTMFDEAPPAVCLAEYDWIVLSSSAGKDSQAMIDVVFAQAEAEGVTRRVVVCHADLGRVEWPGTPALAESQARRYGLRFEVVKRPQGDLLSHVEQRGMWPSPKQRYCTSDHKRAQVRTLYTRLADETRARPSFAQRARMGMRMRPVRILSCMGMRAEESPARAKLRPLSVNPDASNGRREVTDWLPLHGWTEAEVWARISASRMADLVAPSYALGMPRLSCCFCIFSPRAGLVLAGKHNPELLDQYVAVEKQIGHTFRQELSMADVKRAVDAGEGGRVTTWAM